MMGTEAISPQSNPGNIKITLHKRQNSLSQYQTTCISKHYALNNQILAAFESHYRNELLKVAYHLGLKFVETALLEIPKHGYFYAHKHASLRVQSSVDAIRVTQLLQEIIARESTFATECHKIERLSYLANEQYEHLPTYESKRTQVELELYPAASNWYNNYHRRTGSAMRSSNADPLTSTILACGDSFASVFCPGGNIDSQEYKSAFPDNDMSHPDYSHPHFPRTYSNKSSSKTAATTATTNFSSRPEEDKEFKFPPTPAEQREPSFDRPKVAVGVMANDLFPSSESSLRKLKTTGSLLDDDAEEDKKYESHSSLEMAPHEAAIPIDEDVTETVQTVPGVVAVNDKSSKRDKNKKSRRDKEDEKLRQEEKWLQAEQEEKMTDSNRQVRRHSQSDYDLQRALFVSGLGVQLEHHRQPSDASLRSIPEQPFAPPGARKRDQDGLSIGLLSQCHHEDFDSLRDNGRVIVTRVPTYQGRIPDSTNGCTVIAPLLCLHHFHDSSQIPDNGLEDQIIVEVLDEETPNILPLVRQKLGLVQDAFLIPADAHEALMEEQYMCPDQFYSVCGGNILEEQHLDAFVKEISQIGKKKLAATFFFHEHVITILQLRRTETRVWFDIINSLPGRDMFLRAGETTDGHMGDSGRQLPPVAPEEQPIQAPPPTKPMSMRLSSEGLIFGDEDDLIVDAVPPENACRIRCLDGEALKATLRWYACSSFTDENQTYIDSYQWDENLSDFDPRVFQAFLWTEA